MNNKKIDISYKDIEGKFNVMQYCVDNSINIKEVTSLYCEYNQIEEIEGLDQLENLKYFTVKKTKSKV